MKTSYTAQECEPFKTEWRSAKVVKVVDGDTFDLDVDLGFDVHTVTRFRLAEVDAFETRSEERAKGLLAKERVRTLMPMGSTVRIRSHKGGDRGKYGRWICEVLFEPIRRDDGWMDLGSLLLEEGHAIPYGQK